ncbi:unnamed protein product [Linum tenue]|uniref:DYW domain-containing protein n=1 Tax=Linum tenue TaxID=586396 RepID=A0AAV0Q8P4_9ROSI|nr:unnamed protein product [Linum tenue]
MLSQGISPDCYVLPSVVKATAGLSSLKTGVQVHCLAFVNGHHSDSLLLSSLVHFYLKCDRLMEARKVFDRIPRPNVVACSALLSGYARKGCVEETKELLGEAVEMGLEVVSWTSMIASCSQNGKDMEALELFREMQMEGLKPNSVTIPCLLPACGNIAALMHGKAVHCFSLKNWVSNDVYVGTALIDMYANCGRIQLSRRCFDSMPRRNLVSWNALLGGYAMHGKTKEALEVFNLMQKSGQEPDFISFTSVLSACSQGGLTEEGKFYFDSMSKDYGIEPRLEHYSCMVSLLGRAGRIVEAYTMVKQMPMEPDGCIWGPLLSSCRVHHNLAIGEIAARKLFELEPNNPGNYVLLSNIYASKSMWVEVNSVREMMKSKGLRKNPGCSWIEIKNKVHMLLAGDNLHPQMPEITKKLGELRVEMQKSGYLPHTDFVLQDVEEQDKEEMLCDHSEKLAVALGLLNTSRGFPLQVIKNLRICGDCHAVIKFISEFEDREIFVRDTNRFHHFKDGACSCGDLW